MFFKNTSKYSAGQGLMCELFLEIKDLMWTSFFIIHYYHNYADNLKVTM